MEVYHGDRAFKLRKGFCKEEVERKVAERDFID